MNTYKYSSVLKNYYKKLREELTNNDQYVELIKLYNEFLNNYKLYLNGINIDNPLSLFIVYTDMYRNGLLSQKTEFKYDQPLYSIYKLHGIDVINGIGVCRNIATLLDDIARVYGFYTRPLIVNLLDNKSKYEKSVNHVINQISTNNKNYILDPTNNLILEKEKSKTFKCIFYDEKKMIYDKKMEKILLIAGLIKLNTNNHKMDKKLKLPTVTIEEYREEMKKLESYWYTKNQYDFHEGNKKLLNDISLLAKDVSEFQEITKKKLL